MKRIRVRPSRAQSIFGMIVGGVFVLIGIFFVIPIFGAFGFIWTLLAVGITGMSAFQAFSEKSAATREIIIEDIRDGAYGEDIKARLAQLQDFYDNRIITREEYEENRARIIRKL